LKAKGIGIGGPAINFSGSILSSAQLFVMGRTVRSVSMESTLADAIGVTS
jgi:hypothetical protein